MAMSEKILTTSEVAKICNASVRTVAKWFDSGLLKGYVLPGSKDRRIPVKELICFMQKNNMPFDEGIVEKVVQGRRGRKLKLTVQEG